MEVNKDLIKKTGDLVVDSIRSKNMYNINTDILDMILNSSGGLTQGTGYVTSIFIKVKPNTNYTISKVINTAITDPSIDNTMRIGYFTSNKTFISRPTSTTNPYSVTTPATCEYVKISYQHTISGQEYCYNVQLEEGATATTYKPYQELNNQDSYSTTEQRIGTWIDGKPLYRMVVVLPNETTINAGEWIGTGLNNNIETIINGLGVRTGGATSQIRVQATSTAISIMNPASSFGIVIKYIVLEYTKTTD